MIRRPTMAAMGAIVGIALFGSATTVDAQQATRGFVSLTRSAPTG
jgi:hypothetical protein